MLHEHCLPPLQGKMLDMAAVRSVPLPLATAAVTRMDRPRQAGASSVASSPPPPREYRTKASATRTQKPGPVNSAACIASHFERFKGGGDCLHLLPALRSLSDERQRSWSDLDLGIDVPLVSASIAASGGTAADGRPVLTNPSVLCRDGRLLMAARAIHPVTRDHSGKWTAHAPHCTCALHAGGRAAAVH